MRKLSRRFSVKKNDHLTAGKRTRRRSVSVAHVNSRRKSPHKSLSFGRKLHPTDRSTIPAWFPPLFQFLLKNGIGVEFCFRKAGGKDDIDLCVSHLDRCRSATEFPTFLLTKFPIFVAADVLKRYFARLPSPIMTYSTYASFLETPNENPSDPEPAKDAIREIMYEKNPPTHMLLLDSLFRFLHDFCQASDVTHMDSEALSVVFTPGLLRPKGMTLSYTKDLISLTKFVQWMIESPEFFFPEDRMRAVIEECSTSDSSQADSGECAGLKGARDVLCDVEQFLQDSDRDDSLNVEKAKMKIVEVLKKQQEIREEILKNVIPRVRNWAQVVAEESSEYQVLELVQLEHELAECVQRIASVYIMAMTSLSADVAKLLQDLLATTVKIDDGMMYLGEVNPAGTPHGIGKMFSSNGDVILFCGRFVNGQRIEEAEETNEDVPFLVPPISMPSFPEVGSDDTSPRRAVELGIDVPDRPKSARGIRSFFSRLKSRITRKNPGASGVNENEGAGAPGSEGIPSGAISPSATQMLKEVPAIELPLSVRRKGVESWAGDAFVLRSPTLLSLKGAVCRQLGLSLRSRFLLSVKTSTGKLIPLENDSDVAGLRPCSIVIVDELSLSIPPQRGRPRSRSITVRSRDSLPFQKGSGSPLPESVTTLFDALPAVEQQVGVSASQDEDGVADPAIKLQKDVDMLRATLSKVVSAMKELKSSYDEQTAILKEKETVVLQKEWELAIAGRDGQQKDQALTEYAFKLEQKEQELLQVSSDLAAARVSCEALEEKNKNLEAKMFAVSEIDARGKKALAALESSLDIGRSGPSSENPMKELREQHQLEMDRVIQENRNLMMSVMRSEELMASTQREMSEQHQLEIDQLVQDNRKSEEQLASTQAELDKLRAEQTRLDNPHYRRFLPRSVLPPLFPTPQEESPKLSAFLARLRLEQFASAFEKNAVGFCDLSLFLSESDDAKELLNEMIPVVIPRLRFLRAVRLSFQREEEEVDEGK